MLQNLLVQPGRRLSVHLHLLQSSFHVSPACLGSPLSLTPHKLVPVCGNAEDNANKLEMMKTFILLFCVSIILNGYLL